MRHLQKRTLVIVLALLVVLPLSGCVFSNVFTPPYIEVTVDESTFESKFYYGQFSESQQLAYREIYQGLSEQKEEFIIHSNDGNEANNILYAVLFDFPELFWPDGNVVSTAYADTYVSVEPEYNCSVEQRTQKQAEIEAVADTILANVPTTYTEYEKIKYIYEYLVNTIDYVEGVPDDQNLYSALVGKQSVCAGYAKANQYLLEKLGIFCIYVTGDATNAGVTDLHAWNIVQCNGKYYYVDTTWADPLFSAEEQEVADTNLVYDYLCCSEETLEGTHVLDDAYEYPVCDSDDLNYYRLNDMLYASADRKTLLNVMYRSINAKEDSITFKFSGAEVYEQAKNLIMNQLLDDATQYLGRKYYLREVTCHYKEDPQLNKFIIYWSYQ